MRKILSGLLTLVVFAALVLSVDEGVIGSQSVELPLLFCIPRTHVLSTIMARHNVLNDAWDLVNLVLVKFLGRHRGGVQHHRYLLLAVLFAIVAVRFQEHCLVVALLLKVLDKGRERFIHVITFPVFQ